MADQTRRTGSLTCCGCPKWRLRLACLAGRPPSAAAAAPNPTDSPADSLRTVQRAASLEPLSDFGLITRFFSPSDSSTSLAPLPGAGTPGGPSSVASTTTLIRDLSLYSSSSPRLTSYDLRDAAGAPSAMGSSDTLAVDPRVVEALSSGDTERPLVRAPMPVSVISQLSEAAGYGRGRRPRTARRDWHQRLTLPFAATASAVFGRTVRTCSDMATPASQAPSPPGGQQQADVAGNRSVRRSRSAPANMRVPSKLLLELLHDPITCVVVSLQLAVRWRAPPRELRSRSRRRTGR